MDITLQLHIKALNIICAMFKGFLVSTTNGSLYGLQEDGTLIQRVFVTDDSGQTGGQWIESNLNSDLPFFLRLAQNITDKEYQQILDKCGENTFISL